MNIEIDIMYGMKGPQPKQVEFRDLDKLIKLFAGGVRAGKTRTLCAEGLRQTLGFAGNRGLMLRQDGTKFEKTTLEEMFKLIKELQTCLRMRILEQWHKQKKILYFTNGSVIYYGGFDAGSDRTMAKSMECGWWGIDEASEIAESDFNFMLSRFTWVLPNGSRPPPLGLLASNVEECWLVNRFVDPETRDEDFGYVAAQTTDNEQYLPQGYAERLMRQNKASWTEQYMKASWKFTKGRIFVNFDETIHCLGTFPRQKPEYPRYAGIDHGQSHPTAALTAFVDRDDNIFIYREYRQKGIVSNHCKNLNILFDNFKDFNFVALSKDAWGDNREKNGAPWSVADEYYYHKLPVSPAYNNVDQGLSRILQLLAIDPDHKHPITRVLGAPRLYIHKLNCPLLIKEMGNYQQHRTRDGVFLDKPKKIDDDLVDALRYLIMGIGHISMAYKPPPSVVHPRIARLTKLPQEGVGLAW